ncbi:class F sortase [Nocardioides daeguensis]|uniref:class F sortase n=1 Tax=Nocardioides daeguensis TaxID=908359 RepID=UPI001C4762AF|nr:class F sortase [Nocardioides daeguensis]MBV6728366.1 class F sortase [Nocardioides daeguensis]MCR1773175.1 class F sortase [Nocardioides daeguensis]
MARIRPRRKVAALALVGLALATVGVVLVSPWDDERPAPGSRTGDGAVEQSVEPPDESATDPALPTPSAGPAVHGRPTKIEIPSIDVSARVLPIATSGDVLTPPDDVSLVGWWEDGAEPGAERGTVLMAGHTYSRGDGVFDHLAEVTPGESVRVSTPQGVVHYRVDSVAIYPRGEIAELAPRLFDVSGRPRLVLTTCSGYDGEHYQMTTVVRATPAGQDVGSDGPG